MSADIIVKEAGCFSLEELNLIKNLVCKPKYRQASDAEVGLFVKICQETHLNPFKKQIYAIFRRNKADEEEMTIVVGIDGYRAIADRTGKYMGSDDPVIKYDDKGRVLSSTVTVWKFTQNQKCSFASTAYFCEYEPAYVSIWNKMPRLMISKCAEALALRKCFPDQLGGLYIEEEMQNDIENERQDLGDIKFDQDSKEILEIDDHKKVGTIEHELEEEKAEVAPLCCDKPMMVSKFQTAQDKKLYGENPPWYCMTCRKKLKRSLIA